jgi:hypothetical protein
MTGGFGYAQPPIFNPMIFRIALTDWLGLFVFLFMYE